MTNRTICDILRDMRRANETRNYSYLEGLIEEMQWYGNRMESALQDQSDLLAMARKRSELKGKLTKIQDQLRKIQDDLGKQAPKSIEAITKQSFKYW